MITHGIGYNTGFVRSEVRVTPFIFVANPNAQKERQPQWRSSREFETTTRTTTVGVGSTGDPVDEYGEEPDPADEETPGKQKMSVVFVPTFDSTIGIYYRKRESPKRQSLPSVLASAPLHGHASADFFLAR
jgi:hypothetical protein